MGRTRRLLPELKVSRLRGYEDAARAIVARYPGAEAYTDEAVYEFGAAIAWMDARSPRTLVQVLRRVGVPVPAPLHAEVYRIGRHVFRRWLEPGVREAVMGEARPDPRVMRRLERCTGLDQVCGFVQEVGPLHAIWLLHQAAMVDTIPAVVANLSPDDASKLRGDLLYLRALMHRYLTQSDRLEQQPSRREQKETIRRIHCRALQLRSMRRSIYTLGRERKALLGRMRRAEREAKAELVALGASLEQARQALAATEVEHTAAMAELTARQVAELAALEAEVKAALQDFTAALAERQAWAPVAPLQGAVVAVVGDSSREAGYRALVESAGGRFVHVSAVEKLNRVADAAVRVNIVVLIAAATKHQSERLLRKAVGPAALVLRCPKAGLASFDRVLRTEVLLRQSAGAQPGAGPEGDVGEGLAVHGSRLGRGVFGAGATGRGAGAGGPRGRRHH